VSRFSIKSIIAQAEIGEDLTLVDVSRSYNNRGDATETITEFTINGYVDEMSGDEDIVTEGVLKRGDIIVFIDEDEDNVAYLKNGNRFVRNSINYEIKNPIHNPGHWEIMCRKI